MMQVENPAVWEEARKMAEYCGYALRRGDLAKVGHFSITHHPYGEGNFTYQNIEDERLREIFIEVFFSSLEDERPNLSPLRFDFRLAYKSSNQRNFAQLAVLSPDIGRQTLHKGAIVEEDGLAKQGIYPSVQYSWQFGLNSENRGKLHYLRVDLAPDTHANYYLDISPTCFKEGDPYLLGKLPDGIEGLEQAIKRPIPIRIDYEDCAREILERSMLKQLHQACLDLPKPPRINYLFP